MSRSNPTSNVTNPSNRFINWDGSEGVLFWYDRTIKSTVKGEKDGANVEMKPDFTFILLDQLSTIKGFHEKSKSGIYSNEVRDTRSDVLVVKAFKGGEIASGVYAQIKDRVVVSGGKFTANCYIAFRAGKDDKKLTLGAIQFHGAALRSWMDFSKANRSDLYKKAIHLKGFGEETIGSGKKAVTYRFPKFAIKDLSEDTEKEATEIDATVLQPYLKEYFSRTKGTQAAANSETVAGGTVQGDAPDNGVQADPPEPGGAGDGAPPEDDVPF